MAILAAAGHEHAFAVPRSPARSAGRTAAARRTRWESTSPRSALDTATVRVNLGLRLGLDVGLRKARRLAPQGRHRDGRGFAEAVGDPLAR